MFSLIQKEESYLELCLLYFYFYFYYVISLTSFWTVNIFGRNVTVSILVFLGDPFFFEALFYNHFRSYGRTILTDIEYPKLNKTKFMYALRHLIFDVPPIIFMKNVNVLRCGFFHRGQLRGKPSINFSSYYSLLN